MMAHSVGSQAHWHLNVVYIQYVKNVDFRCILLLVGT
jgi:hypothetical protein